ncbi:MAG: cytochrome c [Hyphomicrobium sp.]
MLERLQRIRKLLIPVAAVVLSTEPTLAHADVGSRAGYLERLVRQDCGSCHGMTLKGGLGPALLTERLSNRGADAIATIILDGIPDTPMPPWRGLISDADALWIANYLKKESAP